jgi:hypothetical protein
MGFEAFRIELHGGQSSHAKAVDAVRKLPGIKRDEESVSTPGSMFFVCADGQHVIELEVKDAPPRVSCRFTLCHPPSIDSVFLGLVRELMIQLRMEAAICDDVSPEHSRLFSLNEFVDFSAITSRYIAARRAEWIAAFGDQTTAATTNEVYQRIILPRCEPEIEQRI